MILQMYATEVKYLLDKLAPAKRIKESLKNKG